MYPSSRLAPFPFSTPLWKLGHRDFVLVSGTAGRDLVPQANLNRGAGRDSFCGQSLAKVPRAKAES
jgi:hypothetical protein